MPRVAVVGHVEWIESLKSAMPKPGEIVHVTEWWEDVGGGGSVAAVQLAKLAGGAEFYMRWPRTRGAGVQAAARGAGVTVYAAPRPGEHRRGFVHLDGEHERTITILGERIAPHGDDDLPWENLAQTDAVYFTAATSARSRTPRTARRHAARLRHTLAAASVKLDVLVQRPASSRPRMCSTRRRLRGRPARTRRWWGGGRTTDGHLEAAELPGEPKDSYGAGDSFAEPAWRTRSRRHADPGGARARLPCRR